MNVDAIGSKRHPAILFLKTRLSLNFHHLIDMIDGVDVVL